MKLSIPIILIAVQCFGGEKSKNLLDGVSMQKQHYAAVITNKPTGIMSKGWSEGNCPVCAKTGITTRYVELVGGGCAVCEWSTESASSCARGHYWRTSYLTNGTVRVTQLPTTKIGKRVIDDPVKWAAKQHQLSLMPTAQAADPPRIITLIRGNQKQVIVIAPDGLTIPQPIERVP